MKGSTPVPCTCREETAIGPEETTPELYDRLARMGAPLLQKTVEGIVNGNLKPKPQDHSKATFAPVLKKEDGVLNWSRSAREIHNRVRAFQSVARNSRDVSRTGLQDFEDKFEYCRR